MKNVGADVAPWYGIRAAFANFDPAIVAKFDEKKKLSLIADSSICFPEAKVRGAVDNAAHVLKVCYSFFSFLVRELLLDVDLSPNPSSWM